MRRLCILGALLVALVTNGWAVWQAIQNRREPRGGAFQLTERELPLEAIAFESSITVLRLEWRTERTRNDRFGPAAWLDSSKLASLGFDCGVPLNSPEAPRHYSSMPARRVFLVLGHHGNTSQDGGMQGKVKTGLEIIDADQKPERLRERYPDPSQHCICRGVIRVALPRHDANGELIATPRLEGWVMGPVPSQVSVPKPSNQLLKTFLRSIDEADKTPVGEPRFSARVHWGKNYEPWVDDVRTLSSLSN